MPHTSKSTTQKTNPIYPPPTKSSPNPPQTSNKMPADHGKQFTIYMHAGGPNPWKVVILFEELGLTYDMIFVDTNKRISPQFISPSFPSKAIGSVSNSLSCRGP